jgi:preprotein translocase subunit SecB
MADDNQNPLFQIQRIYLKDLSLEQPNSPQILLEQGQPQVEINLGLGAEMVAEATYEVTVTATVTTKINDKTLFLVEAKQGGIFEIRNIPEEQLKMILGINCPGIVYPYLRAIVSDVCTRAGFPPVVLSEVNFQAMFEAQQAAAQAGLRSTARPIRDEPDRPRRRRVGDGSCGTHVHRIRRCCGRATKRRPAGWSRRSATLASCPIALPPVTGQRRFDAALRMPPADWS